MRRIPGSLWVHYKAQPPKFFRELRSFIIIRHCKSWGFWRAPPSCLCILASQSCRVCCKGSVWKSTRPCIGAHTTTVRLLRRIYDVDPSLADHMGISCPMVGVPCLGLASACPSLWDWWEEGVGHQGRICLV